MLFFSWSVKSTSSNKGIDVINSFVISTSRKLVFTIGGGGIVVVVVLVVVVVVLVVVVVGIAANDISFWNSSLSKLIQLSAAHSDSWITFVTFTVIVTITSLS